MKIFISWSGEASLRMAKALRDWLPTVIQQVKPFLSSEDIQIGGRWFEEIGKQLDETNYGILALTREALGSKWLYFEAGALSKKVTDARVVPFLVGVTPSELLGGPLSNFHMVVSPTENEVRKLLTEINAVLGESKLDEAILQKTFTRAWPDLQEDIRAVEELSDRAEIPSKRDSAEVLEHLVELCLGISQQVSQIPRVGNLGYPFGLDYSSGIPPLSTMRIDHGHYPEHRPR
jgi:TIR domain